MKVKDFVKHLQNYSRQHPLNGERTIFIKVDHEMCIEFGEAANADGMPGEGCLILIPNEIGEKFKLRELKMVS